MNIKKFKDDLARAMKLKNSTQMDVVSITGVSQPALSMFLNGKRKGLSGEGILKLWPFVYGEGNPSPDPPHGE